MGADLSIKAKYQDTEFRDSYNDYNLLWQFGLNYWVWIAKMLNKDNYLTVTKIEKVLTELKKREPVFKENLKKLDKRKQVYFKEKYKDFKEFLNTALKLKEKIHCWI